MTGPSGCGKSTLLQLLGGLDRPTEGEVWLGGRRVDHLGERARHLPSELSGGQRQRVAIARALANEPLVILADEPTGNLDSAATLDILRLFDELRAAGQTLVLVTHDERVAATADRVVSLRDGTLADDRSEQPAAPHLGRLDADLDGDERGVRRGDAPPTADPSHASTGVAPGVRALPSRCVTPSRVGRS